jgi:hypothetical protein
MAAATPLDVVAEFCPGFHELDEYAAVAGIGQVRDPWSLRRSSVVSAASADFLVQTLRGRQSSYQDMRGFST